MTRYIDADELKRVLSDDGLIRSDLVALRHIDAIPTADVQEVKRGKWIRTRLCNECSICRAGWVGLPETKYCPNCGARMDGNEK